MVICHTFIVFEFHIVPCIHDINTLTAFMHYIDGLVQERRNSSVLAMELRLSCTYPFYALFERKVSSVMTLKLITLLRPVNSGRTTSISITCPENALAPCNSNWPKLNYNKIRQSMNHMHISLVYLLCVRMKTIWWLVFQNQISRTGTSNYIPQYEDVCARNRNQRQGQVITSHSICWM